MLFLFIGQVISAQCPGPAGDCDGDEVLDHLDLDDNNNWIPTIPFRSDAKINKDLKTLTDRNDSDVCTSSVTTYQSDGKAFKIIKKVENGYFEEATPNKCITKNSEYLE